MRSAKAPAISAGVMMANVIWNIMKTDFGMVPEQRTMPPCPSVCRNSQLEAADERLSALPPSA